MQHLIEIGMVILSQDSLLEVKSLRIFLILQTEKEIKMPRRKIVI